MQKAINIFRFLNRLFPALFAIWSGIMKFGGQFTNHHTKLNEVVDPNTSVMVFAFYSNSGNYIYIIASTQILGGLLLLLKKTSVIGALICLTVFTNVMFVNYYFHFSKVLVIFMALLNLSFIITLSFEYKRLKNLLVL